MEGICVTSFLIEQELVYYFLLKIPKLHSEALSQGGSVSCSWLPTPLFYPWPPTLIPPSSYLQLTSSQELLVLSQLSGGTDLISFSPLFPEAGFG